MAAPPRPNDLPPDRLSGAPDQEEYISLPDDPDAIEIIEDSSGAFADEPAYREESTPEDPGFYGNLAAVLPPQIQDNITFELVRLIEQDKKAREKRDEQYEEGIKRTGMGKEAPGGAAFEGASKVVHPMMLEASIDYQSRIMKELFPPAGPVKPSIVGAVTKRKTDKADRIAEHMNFQITRQIKGARTTMEVTLAQVPLGGSQFIRQWWDHDLKQPAWQFASIDKVLVPFNAPDFASAKRKTFLDTVDEVEFRNRVTSGMYLDLDLPKSVAPPTPTKAEAASLKVQGAEDPGENLDGDRELYETSCYLEVTQGMADAFKGMGDAEDQEKVGSMVPYLVTIDVTSRKMLAMYRDWEKGDEARDPIEHLFEFTFVPWGGAYGIGLAQIIGGLSAAATGALRALLDTAMINNIPALLALKGSGMGGQTKVPNPGEMVELDGGLETDDIRKRVMPMPFNPPSAVLFQLLGFLVDASKGVIRTTLDETPQNTGSPVPVGTQISRVEEGMVVFSAVHGRAHAGLDRLLRGLHRLNRLYLPDEVKVDGAGTEIMVRREDYDGPCDVMPVSDPTIYSDLQRFNQLTYIQQRMALNPQLWKQREVELAGLKLIKWADPETLLNVVPEPHETNAVEENLMMALGQPVAVYPGQDHLAHIQVLLDFMKSPALGANPLFAPTYLPAALKHANEHIAYFYANLIKETVDQASGISFEEVSTADAETKREYDRLLGQASQQANEQVLAAMQNVLPVIQEAMQQLQAIMPKPPMDPAMAAVQAAGAETARKAKDDETSASLAKEKQDGELAIKARANDVAAAGVVAKQQAAEIDSQTELETTRQDNNTALEISRERIRAGMGTHFSNGQSMGKE